MSQPTEQTEQAPVQEQTPEQVSEQQEEAKPELPSYPLSANLRQALKEYLGLRPYNEVSGLVTALDQDSVPGQAVVDVSQLLQQERPVRLMQGLQMNVQQINQARAQARQQQQAAPQAVPERSSPVIERLERAAELEEVRQTQVAEAEPVEAEEAEPVEIEQKLEGQVAPEVRQQGPSVSQPAPQQGGPARIPPQLLERLRQQRMSQQQQ